MPPSADTHVALLRGINLGRNHKLPMKDLAALFAAAGAHEVRTWIQSGNVVFRAADSAAVCTRVEAAIVERFGFAAPIVLRTAAELVAIVAENPFPPPEDPTRQHVVFLSAEIDATGLGDPERYAPDAFAVRGREIYLSTPNGLARTKLTNAFFDRRGEVFSTMRNWRTTLKLLELAGA